ncbi:tail fiber domain-containing protein [Rhodocytophaga rosea]|uniref:Tail fiber domain-containing protein n=1 Tax=Rhodocytophaga rosea TaxID=2704465 RepID=A0A6C0GSB9_9BACT|nr:tail fiber domain-containing protein [Rhodocytophaga rosea]QHT70837.1 tail fiber domain-containing protein [Rhodocytophaga rosea]
MSTFRFFASLLTATLLLTQPAAAQLKNFFAGPGAGASNTTGSRNTFVGAFAGFSNTSGNSNTFFGESAGSKITNGFANAFFGTFAGTDNTTGGLNAFFGENAGRKNTICLRNAFFGASAGTDNTSGSFNAFFGEAAGANNTTSFSNAFFGAGAGLSNTIGRENTFVGRSAGIENITGNGNSYFGFEAGNPSNLQNLTNATAIGHRALVSRSNALVLGSIAGKNEATSDVNVGIGVDAPTFQLHLSKNSAAKPGSSSWTVASDERLKKNVQTFTDGLNLLLQVKPVTYHYNGKAGMPTEYGFPLK